MTEYMKTKDKITNLERRNPVGVDSPPPLCPRVARSSQPWAEGRNPFGIGPDGALALCESKRLTGWVLYDGECGLCTGWARRFGAVLNRRRFELAPLQTPWVRERLGLVPGVVLTEMRLLLSDGSIYGGADAIIEIARRIWWGWPVFLFGRLPGGRSVMRAIYRWIAARRRCNSGACYIAPPKPKSRPSGSTLWWLDWVPLAWLTSHALIVRNELP